MSDCVVALQQLNYEKSLHSRDVLRQVIRRLPSKFHNKWAEHCFKIRRHKKPSLRDLESWLQERILASKEAYLPPKHDLKKRGNTGIDRKWFGKTTFSKPACIICEENHLFCKCESYKTMTGKEKMKFVKKQNLCFNCLERDHRAKNVHLKTDAFILNVQKHITHPFMTILRRR